MSEQKEFNVEQEDSKEELRRLFVDIKEWISYLLSKWKVIVPIGILGGIIGFLYANFKAPSYLATADFVVEESGGRSGGLGGLAALAGVNLGGGGGGAFQGDNILELYKSRTMITKALLSEDGGQLLLDHYMKMQEIPEAWEERPDLLALDFRVPAEERSYQQDSILGRFVKNIKENYLSVNKPDKMLSLIRVQVTTPEEQFSKKFTDALVETVNNFYIETRTKKTQASVEILQRQTDSVRAELDEAILAAAKAREVNPNANPTRMSLQVPYAKHEVDVQVNQALMKELIKNLEISKLELRKETPLIQIIDRPVLPLEEIRTGRAKALVIGGILAGLLIVGYLIGIEYYRKVMEEE